MTFSFGVAELRTGDSSAGDLLARSDAALYDAKARRDSVSTGDLVTRQREPQL